MTTHLTATEYRAQAKAKRNKYRARKTVVDGITFDSALEAKYYANLKLLEKAGAVYGVECQVEYPIEINGKHCCKYLADFRFYDKERDRVRVIDCKGFDTAVSRLKRKLVAAVHGVEVEVIKA